MTAAPNERRDEHWNARLIREQVEQNQPAELTAEQRANICSRAIDQATSHMQLQNFTPPSKARINARRAGDRGDARQALYWSTYAERVQLVVELGMAEMRQVES